MKITINTDILKKHEMSLGEFLLLLVGYYGINIKDCQDSILKKHLADKNLFSELDIILSNNSKDIVARILMESDEKVINSGLDFEDIAKKMMECYPDGTKPGRTYSWRNTVEEIAQKLRTLVVRYDFIFTPEEAIRATKEYVATFKSPYEEMLLLRSFILRIDKEEMESLFMSIIENNREYSR